MKIAVISDSHLGFGSGERKKDAVLAFEEAVERASDMADAILFAGDMFDSPYPRSYAALEAVRILASLKKKRGAFLEGFDGFPFIAITGNHERRSKEFLDPIQMLEKAGLLVRLHGTEAVLEKGSDKVRVFGISSVPERLAGKVFRHIDPRPREGMINILMFHQSITPYVYSPLEKPTLDISDLPKGFDFIINGHIHKRTVKEIDGSIFLICGSTILTQLKDEGEKGFNIIDTETRKVEFVPLKKQRKLLIREVERENLEDVKKEIREGEWEMKPILKVVTAGLSKADFSDIEERCILVIQRKREERKPKQIRAEFSMDMDEMFEALAEGDEEAVERMLMREWNDKKGETEELEVP